MEIKFIDLAKQHGAIRYDEIMRIIKAGRFVGSEKFEEKFAEYHGSKYCVGVGSGTDALWLSLLALGIGPGDEVIVPANTFIATPFAVSHVGATPVFCDVDPHGYIMTRENVEAVITEKTKAIMPVHMHGQPVNMDTLKGLGVYIIEDCAQATGAEIFNKKVGTFGDVGCFSFYPTKNLGGLGQGGAIITENEDVAKAVRSYGNVGRKEGSWDEYVYVGFNSRLDAVNAEFLTTNLRYLDLWNKKRIARAAQYESELEEIDTLFTPAMPIPDVVKPVFHLYEIKLDKRRTRTYLMKYLNKHGIPARLHNSIPCHRQPMYKKMGAKCPVTDELADTLLSLPMHPFITEEEVSYVCDKIKEWFSRR